MIITVKALEDLRTGFKLNFKGGIAKKPPTYQFMATPVSSTTRIETYGFLGSWPIFREWLGERRIKSLEEKAYVLANRKFEMTIGISEDKLNDDNLGLYPAMIGGWGEEAGQLPDRLAYEALQNGHIRPCFDNQYFFDTDHPVGDGTASNSDTSGAGQPWFLLDCSKSLKPLIMQERQPPTFVMITNPESDHVFKTGEYLAGAKARAACGYTFWQLAYRSTLPLTEENYLAAANAMAQFRDDEGEPLAVKPTHVVVGTSNKSAARNLFKKANKVGGESNIYFEDVAIVEAERLA